MSKFSKNKIIIFLGIILTFLMLPKISLAATYYMRADGTAANKVAATGSCTSVSATMNIAVHNSQTFSPGDTIILCDNGGIFTATLIVPSSGLSGSPITYKNSGTPIISGADVYTTANYRWTASRVANEWYLEASGGGDPVISEVEMVWVDGADYKKGNPGSLASGQWAWGDNDSLGYNTLYVYAISDLDTSGVTIEGSQRASGIQMDTKSYITIDGITIRRAGDSIHTQRGLLYMRLGSNIVIQSSHIYDSAWYHLIQVDRTDYVTISNNRLHGVLDSHETWHYGCAVSTDAVVGTTPDNGIIQNNVVYDIRPNDGAGGYYGAGFNIQGAYSGGVNDGPKNWLIQDNEIYGYNGNAIYFRRGVSNAIVRRNYIHDVSGEGIQIRQGNNNNLIYNNIIFNVEGPALQLDGKNPASENPAQDGNKIYNNTIIDYHGSSWGAGGTNSIHIIGTNTNTIVKNNLVVCHDGDCLKIYNNSVAGTDSDYNCFYKNGTGVNYLMKETTNYTSLANWQIGTGKDANSLEGNPAIISLTPASVNDVKLSQSSPCINTGTTISDFSNDYANIVRPQGSAWDIGAYEYVEAAPPPDTIPPAAPTGLAVQ